MGLRAVPGHAAERRPPHAIPARVALATIFTTICLPHASMDAWAGTTVSPAEPARFSVHAADDGLAESPLDAEGLGFSLRVPIGSGVRVDRTGGSISFVISGPGEEPKWRIRAARVTPGEDGATAAGQCERFLEDLKRRDPRVEAIASEVRKVAGRDAHIVYASVPVEGGEAGTMGLYAVPTGDGAFVALSIVMSGDAFAQTRTLLERSLDTMVLRDTAKVLAENMALLVRGGELIAAITPERLRATIHSEPRIYRMWRPKDDGAKEDFGYMVIRVREGQQGEVDASRDPSQFKGEDAEKGLLASIDARVVVNGDPTHTVDAQSRYFVRWDRSGEAWSVRTTERQRRASRSSAQTGLRLPPSAGAPRPTIQVITASRDGMTREPLEWAVPPSYLSQAELIVLGELLPRAANAAPIEFTDYAFDQREQKLPLRRERWAPDGTGWRLETQSGSSPSKIVQEFDAQGRRVRRVDIDGSVTELIALEDLRKLWKSKGLPVD